VSEHQDATKEGIIMDEYEDKEAEEPEGDPTTAGYYLR